MTHIIQNYSVKDPWAHGPLNRYKSNRIKETEMKLKKFKTSFLFFEKRSNRPRVSNGTVTDDAHELPASKQQCKEEDKKAERQTEYFDENEKSANQAGTVLVRNELASAQFIARRKDL